MSQIPTNSKTNGSRLKGVSHRPGGIINTLLYILLLPLYLLCKFIPKNSCLYAFGSCHGQHFADNTKYLYLYARIHARQVRSVFFSRNRDVLQRLTEAGYEACHPLSIKGVVTAIRAKKCFLSHSTHDIHPLLIGGAEIIQLWHGTPLKAICHDVDAKGNHWKSRLKYSARETLFRIFPYLNTSMTFKHLVIASDHVRSSFRTAFRCDDDKLLVLGQARNDCLEDSYSCDSHMFPETGYLVHLKRETEYIVSWLPTHRLFSGGTIMDLIMAKIEHQEMLEEILERRNTILVLKDHYLDSRSLKSRFPENKSIVAYEYADPYPLLRQTDILIADYSSVFFDFLLLNRPILFAPFVFDQGVRSFASYYHKYEDVTPGPICADWKEVLQALDDQLRMLREGSPDPYAEQRLEMCQRFNKYKGDNSKRIVEKFFPAALA